MLLDLRGQSRRRWAGTLLVIVLGATPFLALQAWQNVAMTGRLTEFPSDYYVEQTYPAPMVGFHTIDWPHTPMPRLLEKQMEKREVMDIEYARHQPGRIWEAWRDRRLHFTELGATSQLVLLILVPIGLFGLVNRPRIVFAAMLPLFFGFYACYVFYFVHYAVALLPVVVLLTLLGAETLCRAVPAAWRRSASAVAFVMIAGGAIAAFPQFNPYHQEGYRTPELTPLEHTIAALPPVERAVVLIKISPGMSTGEDAAYNVDAAWPEDSRVLRCHDLGGRDGELYRYLSSNKQGDRVVYRYDRGSKTIARLGTADELSKR